MKRRSTSLLVIACGLGQVLIEAALSAVDPTLPACPADWRVEVVAAAPQVVHPSVVCCAPDGRVFVAEDPMDISAPSANLQLGRILCLHPDGKTTVFAEKLHAVFGMQYLDGKLYVLHNPRFSVFRDEDGVGREREELIESTNPNPWALGWNDHIPANFKLAMDGYFYVAVGDKGVYGAVGKDGKRVDLFNGGILRLRPNGTELEVFSTGIRNILDVAINAEDDIFTYDNTDERDWWSRLTHMLEGGFYGYPYDFKPRRPYTLWMMEDYGGGAATGTLCYNEDALPIEYHGNLFLADFGRRQVMRLRIARDGATYKVVAREEDLLIGPPEFRPVGIAWAPDGLSMYVCDWNHIDDKENVKVGRLLKVSYTGKSQALPKPDWYLPAAMGRAFEASTPELVLGLSHPSHSVRMVAQRRLAERGPAVVEPLKELLVNTQAPNHARWHALWALDGLDGGPVARPASLQALTNADASLRIQAVRQVGLRRTKEGVDRLVPLLKDTNATVRFYAATALGRIHEPGAVTSLTAALDDPDLFARYAVFTALNRTGRANDTAWPIIAKGLEHSKSAVREGTLLAMRQTYQRSVVDALVKFIRNFAQPAPTRAQALEVLAELHRKLPEWKGEWWAYHPVDKPPPEKTVEWEGTTAVLAELREALNDRQVAVRNAAVEGLRAAKEISAARPLRELFARETDLDCKRTILRALSAFKDPEAKELILSTLENSGAAQPLLIEAITAGEEIAGRQMVPALMRLLKSHSDDQQVLLKAIQTLGSLRASETDSFLSKFLNHAAPAVRISAVNALAQMGGEGAVDDLIPLANDTDVEVRRAVINALGRLKDKKAVPILGVVFQKEETKFEATSALAQMPDVRALDAYLFGLGSPNVVVRDNCRKALSAIAADALREIESRLATNSLGSSVIGELQKVYRDLPGAQANRLFQQAVKERDPNEYLEFAMKNKGDLDRGRKFFFDLQGVACIRCHAVEGQGGDLGPNLSSIGAQYGRQQLAESILYPSKVVRDGYRQEIIATASGDEISGALKGETAGELIVQDAGGNKHHLRKTDIKERRASALSLMPDGLQAGLSLQDFVDLVSFLEALKSKASETKASGDSRKTD
ncbi:MAG: PVC-type heme-binding CxxCH protein [Verrucomicrobiota bacterium]